MRPPGRDAFEMLLVEIARPPDDPGHMTREIDHMLAGAAAGLDHVTRPPGKVPQQHFADRLVVAVKRRGVETAVGFDPASVLAEFNDIFSHVGSGPGLIEAQGLSALNCDCSSSR